MTNSAWCDVNKGCTVLTLLDMCHNPKCNCQKQITFTPRQFQREGVGFKKTMKIFFMASQTAWIILFKPAVSVTAPFIGMAISAKTKNPKVAQATTNF